MSSKFARDKRAVYDRVKVVNAEDVWVKNKDKFCLDTEKYEFIGKVEKSLPSIVQKTYVSQSDADNKRKFVDDFSSLNLNTKSKIFDNLFAKDSRKQKVYIVRPKQKKNKKGNMLIDRQEKSPYELT